jgi:outer membrane receptor protein involved in Fe transport
MQEVLVTAQKKEERLQDVPIPVTTVEATSLAENNHTRLRDYFDTVPGFVVSPGPSAGNQQMLTIRGVSSGAFGNPTVGVTVDDVPYGAFTREYAPDIDPSDLARVEVLRGPQGALYGANSMGGLLKYVTVDPSTAGVSGRIEAGTSSVSHGSDVGYNFRGAVNVPLNETTAIRASAFTRQDPGFIDNPALGTQDVNEARVSGGRLSALWKPSDVFSLKLSALYQKTDGDGLSEVVAAPGLGELQQNYIPGIGRYDQENQAYSAVIAATLGRVDLTSVTGYNVFDYHTSNDYTYLLGASAQRFFGVTGAPTFADGGTDKFTQELRLSMPLGARFDWLVGAFYTHEDTSLLQTFAAENVATGQVVGTIQALDIPIKLTEYALFTDLTVHFTDRFDLQIGGRESHLEPIFASVTESGAAFPTTLHLAPIDNTSDVFTYLVTPRFKFSPDMMMYARIASGYRPARANSFNPDPLVPRTAAPDKTKNYEIGLKGNVWDRRLSLDASVYYIDWKDIQILLFDARNNLTYNTNGSAAKSEGVELSLALRPLPGLTISAWGSYNHAVLTEGFPPDTAAYGPSGSRMPFSPRLSGSVSVEQRFPLVPGVSGFAGVTVIDMGDRRGPFIATPARAEYPGYTTVDLRAGAEFSSWKVNVYANNVGDKRVPIGGGAGTFPPTSFFYLQPRTLGLSAVKSF